MTTDLSRYTGTITFEGFEKIRLNHFQVCELLQDYVISAISWVEARDLLVHRVTISPEVVRAYPSLASLGQLAESYVGPGLCL